MNLHSELIPVLFIVSCSLCCLAAVLVPLDNLRAFCNGHDVDYLGAEEVRAAIEALDEKPDVCPKHYHQTLRDLKELLSTNLTSDVCTPENYRLVKQFHTRYITNYVPEVATVEELKLLRKESVPTGSIPKSLFKFFVLYVTHVNSMCLQEAVTRLEDGSLAEQLSKIEPNEWELVKIPNSKLWGFSDVAISEINNQAEGAKLYLQVSKSANLRKVKKACNKFKPIYDEIFTIFIKLSNLGYKDTQNTNYQRGKLREDSEFKRWPFVIEVCEIFKDIEIIETSSNTATIISLTEEEFKEASENYQSEEDSELEVIVEVAHKPVSIQSGLDTTTGYMRDWMFKNFETNRWNLITDSIHFLEYTQKKTKEFLKSSKLFVDKDGGDSSRKVIAFYEKHLRFIDIGSYSRA